MDHDACNEDDGRFDDHGDSKPDKKIRKRKKKLYQAIKSQMEFYFSDSNLLKDKFLSNMINSSEDGYIEISLFLRFNKIRALTNSPQEIAAALSKSELVQVSEDSAQIKRIWPVVDKEDVDECTIYVEHLPLHADHNWITTVFGSFGTISYISLPRYKHTGKLKGFAFVEFETIESAQNACRHFGLNSPSQQEQRENNSSESEKVEISAKRKRSESDDDIVKRARTSSKEAEDPSIDKIMEEQSPVNDKKQRKKRKRKKKQKPEEEEEPLNLRVMSKIEWKKWRNKYLAMQKAATAQIKKSLLGDGFPTYKNYTPTHNQDEVEEPEKVVKTLEFQPAVIVFVQLNQPPASVSDFKKQARSLTNVAYIEAMEGDTSIYIRCADSDSAKTYVRSTRSGLNGTSRILEGEEEKTYWDKIQRDRENKFLSKTKQKKRGIEKLMTKAEKIVEKSRHIRFEDD